MATHSSILAWEIHGQKSLVGYSLKDHKELDMTEQLRIAEDLKVVCSLRIGRKE